jgi:hypothetical protein
MGDDYSTTSGRIIHPSCEEDCPGFCTNDWIFSDEVTQMILGHSNETQRQKKLDVSCGKINNFLLSW